MRTTHATRAIVQGDRAYPDRLISRLGTEAPKLITVAGPVASLSMPLTAFFCSKETPGATILKAIDQAAALREAGQCVVGGFHSPLEKDCLDILLRGTQPVVIVIARSINALRLPAPQRKAFDDGRLTIVSPFAGKETRVTADLARQRNRFIAALADAVIFAFISPGGSSRRSRQRSRRGAKIIDSFIPNVSSPEQDNRDAGISDNRKVFFSYTGSPCFLANSLSDTCGRAPMCWITSAAASAPSRPAFS